MKAYPKYTEPELQSFLDELFPVKNFEKEIYIRIIDTPLGSMYAVASENGLCILEFADRRMLPTELKDISRLLKCTIVIGNNAHINQAEKQLEEYFEGNRINFELSLHTPGTPFQNSVWQKLQEIPFGKTFSYKQQSIKLGNIKAIRAVAGANGQNRIAIIIPCHRVIGDDGCLTGYGGGLPRKKWLIDFEKKQSGQILELF